MKDQTFYYYLRAFFNLFIRWGQCYLLFIRAAIYIKYNLQIIKCPFCFYFHVT